MSATRRVTVIGFVIFFIVAAVITTVVDKASAAHPPGHQTPGIHVKQVSKQAKVRYRVNARGYRVRGATHARAATFFANHSKAVRKRMCVEFGMESPHQVIPTINVFCDRHVVAVTYNLVECGGLGALSGVAALLATPIGAEIAAVGAFTGCEFSKGVQYFYRLAQCNTGHCPVRLAPQRSKE